MESLKKRIHSLIYQHDGFKKFLYGLILINVISLILESYEGVRQKYHLFLDCFEILSVAIFTIEYFCRIWVADMHLKIEGSALKKRVHFIFSKLGIIDLIAILPFFLPFLFAFDLRIVRILRLFRLLRVFKMGRFSESMKLINSVLKDTKEELITTIFMTFILLVFSSTLMYYIEHDAQPEQFASIIHSFWWSVATLTTVGYGDVYPVTGMGKFLSAIIALIGIGFVALPTGIISSAFIEKIQENKKKHSHVCECPNCGTKFEN